ARPRSATRPQAHHGRAAQARARSGAVLQRARHRRPHPQAPRVAAGRAARRRGSSMNGAPRSRRARALWSGAGLLLIAAAVVAVALAPASPHGALASTAVTRFSPFSKRVKVGAISNHSLSNDRFTLAQFDAFLKPRDPGPLTLILELTGGARLTIADQTFDVAPNDAVHRQVIGLPPLPDAGTPPLR